VDFEILSDDDRVLAAVNFWTDENANKPINSALSPKKNWWCYLVGCCTKRYDGHRVIFLRGAMDVADSPRSHRVGRKCNTLLVFDFSFLLDLLRLQFFVFFRISLTLNDIVPRLPMQ